MRDHKFKAILFLVLLSFATACGTGTSSKGTSGGDPEIKVGGDSGSGSGGIYVGSFGDDIFVELCVAGIGVITDYGVRAVRWFNHPAYSMFDSSGGFLTNSSSILSASNLGGVEYFKLLLNNTCRRAIAEYEYEPFSLAVTKDGQRIAVSQEYLIMLTFVADEQYDPDAIGTLFLDPSGFSAAFAAAATPDELERATLHNTGSFHFVDAPK